MPFARGFATCHLAFITSLEDPLKLDVIIPILQVKTLRPRDVTWPATATQARGAELRHHPGFTAAQLCSFCSISPHLVYTKQLVRASAFTGHTKGMKEQGGRKLQGLMTRGIHDSNIWGPDDLWIASTACDRSYFVILLRPIFEFFASRPVCGTKAYQWASPANCPAHTS